MNCCKPKQVGTKEHGKRLKRIEIHEDVRVPDKEAKNWKLEGQKRRTTRKESKRQFKKFEMGGFMAQKGLWNLAREKMLLDRGALSKEEGDVVREYKAMHEEHFLSSLLREVGDDKKDRVLEADRETK